MTLVELLVVIAILAVLVTLSVPAMSRAIARSQQTACTNNQYQIAFALLRYDEQMGSIPGWLNDSPNGSTLACSWAVPLLPFLGRNDVFDMWPALPNNATIDTFVCRANPPGRDITYPVLHYAANAGVGGAYGTDGVFQNVFRSSGTAVSLDTIADADGVSTTLAFAEKAALRFAPHTWRYAPQSAPAGVPFGSGTASPPIFGVAAGSTPIVPVINNAAIRAFAPSSTHPGGVVVAFCDGHTAFLSDKLQSYEYAQLLTRKTRWSGTTNVTNSADMNRWLLRNNSPYLLDEKILRPQ